MFPTPKQPSPKQLPHASSSVRSRGSRSSSVGALPHPTRVTPDFYRNANAAAVAPASSSVRSCGSRSSSVDTAISSQVGDSSDNESQPDVAVVTARKEKEEKAVVQSNVRPYSDRFHWYSNRGDIGNIVFFFNNYDY